MVNTAFLIDNDLVMTNVLLAWEQDRLFGFSGRNGGSRVIFSRTILPQYPKQVSLLAV